MLIITHFNLKSNILLKNKPPTFLWFNYKINSILNYKIVFVFFKFWFIWCESFFPVWFKGKIMLFKIAVTVSHLTEAFKILHLETLWDHKEGFYFIRINIKWLHSYRGGTQIKG